MKEPVDVILVFDIGKTNKKYYVFDQNFDILDQSQIVFEEVLDDDGDAADDITGIENWILQVVEQTLADCDTHLIGINFSTYGASFVHIDDHGKRIGPIYNYTKNFPFNLFETFVSQHDRDGMRILNTGSPGVGMLNSGFQLYWLKYHKPEFYRKVRMSLHFPQYLSYLLSGVPMSDYTSLGCHTALWNYTIKNYDQWVRRENIHKKLPPLVSTFNSINCKILEKSLKVGVGIHDSSAALLPYLSAISEPFILISTGTWSVALNPFSDESLTTHDIRNGGLYYMQTNGKPIIAQRLFLGYEFEKQVKFLAQKYKASIKKIRSIKYKQKIDRQIISNKVRFYQFEHLEEEQANIEKPVIKLNLKKAYHQLMAELVDIQIRAVENIIKNSRIKRIIIDGGFIKNKVFLKMIASRLPGLPIYASKAAAGSAIGAAIALMPDHWSKKTLKKNYKLKRIYAK